MIRQQPRLTRAEQRKQDLDRQIVGRWNDEEKPPNKIWRQEVADALTKITIEVIVALVIISYLITTRTIWEADKGLTKGGEGYGSMEKANANGA